MLQGKAALVGRRQVARDVFVLGFEAPEVAAATLPGQFVNLLQRPGPLLFSISAVRWKSSGKIGCWPTRRNQYLALEESDSIRWMMPCQ